MKKITLFLVAMIMATISFAQTPVKLNKQFTAQKPAKVQLTETQRNNIIGKVDGRKAKITTAKAVRPMKARTAKVDNRLATTREFKRSLNESTAKKFDASNVKLTQKSGKSAARKAAPRRIEGVEPTTAPAGLQTETYVYTATSYVDMGNVSYNVELGVDGNDVYVQGVLRSLPQAWIKGVKEGNTITFAKDQYLGEVEVLDYETQESLGFFPATLQYQNGTTGQKVDFVLLINPETGVLDDADNYGALYFSDGQDGMLDVLLGSRLTPMSALGEISYDLVTPPTDAEVIGVDINAFSYVLGKQVSNSGMMAITGDEIYVLGLCPDVPGWVKGTVGEGNVVTFAKGQYIGQYMNRYDMWFMGVNPADPNMSLIDVLATWNPDERTLTFDTNTWIVENADPLSLMYADVLYDVFVEPISDGRTVVIPPIGLQSRPHVA